MKSLIDTINEGLARWKNREAKVLDIAGAGRSEGDFQGTPLVNHLDHRSAIKGVEAGAGLGALIFHHCSNWLYVDNCKSRHRRAHRHDEHKQESCK